MDYLHGFGNEHRSEAMPNCILPGQNSPQKVPYGLYAEQLSGSAFTVARAQNFRSWLYRILPSVIQNEFEYYSQVRMKTAPFNDDPVSPGQLRWDPMPIATQPMDFVDSLFTIAGHGSPASMQGAAIHLYACNQSMKDRYCYNADGEFLIIPQQGRLLLKTEFGVLELAPCEIAIIPRGIKFQIDLLDKMATGYVAENFGTPLRLPELGVLGANGLAQPRDFLYPTACYEDKKGDYELLARFQGHWWRSEIKHSPFNVVAWHGNYAPCKYNLKLFNVINTVSFDHPDPSIFTVLHSPSSVPGVANLDFVIFPERWMVAENTFRPPYFHRNIMSEYMGLIAGAYDAKEEGFLPGGGSLHNCMSAHGPDKDAYEKAVQAELKPEYYQGTLAFMLESCFAWIPTHQALCADFLQDDYLACWQSLKKNFKK